MSISEVINYRCNECGSLHSTEDLAEMCCIQRYCNCGKKIGKYNTMCGECKELNMFNEAKKIKLKDYEYDVLYDVRADKYFNDIDEMEEFYEQESLEFPVYVYACKPLRFGLDIENIVENELEDNHYEDAYDQVKDMQELVKLVDIWCEKQNIVSYHCDYEIAILFDDM